MFFRFTQIVSEEPIHYNLFSAPKSVSVYLRPSATMDLKDRVRLTFVKEMIQMNEITYTRKLLLALLTLGLFTSAAFGQGIKNGSFEDSPPDFSPWGNFGGPMVRGLGSSGAPNSNSAQLGPAPGNPVIVPRARGRESMINQNFDCGIGSDESDCWIRFDYKLMRIPMGGSAFVQVRGANVVRRAQLVETPQGAGEGFVTRQIRFPECGNLEVVFSIYDPGRQITPIFRVDEVEDRCGTMFPSIPELDTTEFASAQGSPDDPQGGAVVATPDAVSSTPPVTQPVNRVSRVFVALVILLVILAAAGLFIFLRRRRRRAD
jgi:hypothetical protein